MIKHRDAVVARLASIPLLRGCTTRQLTDIASLTTQIPVAAGTVLIEQGRLGTDFAFILDGTAVVLHDGEPVAQLSAGDHYGEIALLDDGPRTATVVAQTPMTIAVMTRREFDEMLYRVPAVSRRIMRSLAARLRESDLAIAS